MRPVAQMPADIVKDLVKGFAAVTVLVVGMAVAFGAPYRPTLRIRTVAQQEPVLFLKTAMGDLTGTGAIATYGPPYNQANGSLQAVGPFSPQAWAGVRYPFNPRQADVMTPLTVLGRMNPTLQLALQRYEAASAAQQQKWSDNYQAALSHARVTGGQVTVPPDNYGPVATMMAWELKLGQSGTMSAILNRTPGVYNYSVMPSLLFLQGDALHQAAGKLGMKGEQWGILKEENSAYPGPWWLFGYTALYQIPPYSTSSAGDLLAVMTTLLGFGLLTFLPFLPGLRSIPQRLGLHRLVWWRYYRERNQETATRNLLKPIREGFSPVSLLLFALSKPQRDPVAIPHHMPFR